jgi:hypothetical protein
VSIIKQQPLSAVVMPLVNLLTETELSWADREKVTAAIEACRKHHSKMKDESLQYMQQAQAGQACISGQRIDGGWGQQNNLQYPNQIV